MQKTILSEPMIVWHNYRSARWFLRLPRTSLHPKRFLILERGNKTSLSVFSPPQSTFTPFSASVCAVEEEQMACAAPLVNRDAEFENLSVLITALGRVMRRDGSLALRAAPL